MIDSCISYYNGEYDISYSCIGDPVKCKFSLCACMPPEQGTLADECCYYDCASCKSVPAQIKALEAYKRKINSVIKELEEVLNND